MLVRLRIQNFRLLRDVEIAFENGCPTVLIGPNGSGKSTVLEVLDFLQRCGTEGLQAAAAAHGGIQSVRTIGAAGPISFEMTWSFQLELKPKPRSCRLTWSVSLDPQHTGAVVVAQEQLTDLVAKPPTELIRTDDRGVRSVIPEGEAAGKPSTVKSGAKLAFEEIGDPDRFPGLHLLKLLLVRINVMGAISTAPIWARADKAALSPRDSLVIAPKSFLERQGVGLANVLFGLFNEHRDAWVELERAFRAEFPFVARIVFPPDVGGSKITFAFEDRRFDGRKVFASEMSDGMIAYLCLLASILHPDQLGLLALDEPDANLHPSALRRLVALAHGEHGKRRLAIVTHSNALLDELREPARSIRIVEASPQGATIRKLDDDALTAWRKEYSLSELRRTGLIDAANSAYEADE